MQRVEKGAVDTMLQGVEKVRGDKCGWNDYCKGKRD